MSRLKFYFNNIPEGFTVGTRYLIELDTRRFHGRNLKILPTNLDNIMYSMVFEMQHKTINLYPPAFAITTFKGMRNDSLFNLQHQNLLLAGYWMS